MASSAADRNTPTAHNRPQSPATKRNTPTSPALRAQSVASTECVPIRREPQPPPVIVTPDGAKPSIHDANTPNGQKTTRPSALNRSAAARNAITPEQRSRTQFSMHTWRCRDAILEQRWRRMRCTYGRVPMATPKLDSLANARREGPANPRPAVSQQPGETSRRLAL